MNKLLTIIASTLFGILIGSVVKNYYDVIGELQHSCIYVSHDDGTLKWNEKGGL